MMSSIMHRSFAEAMGIEWPRDVAYVESDYRGRREVTWSQVHENRRKWQAEILARKRRVDLPRVLPCYVWTFYNRQLIPYHGWYCYVVTRHFEISVNFRGYDEELATSIMRAVPCGLLPCEANFYRWMEAFTKQHRRPKRKGDPRKAGSIVGWLEDRKRFTLTRPKPQE